MVSRYCKIAAARRVSEVERCITRGMPAYRRHAHRENEAAAWHRRLFQSTNHVTGSRRARSRRRATHGQRICPGRDCAVGQRQRSTYRTPPQST